MRQIIVTVFQFNFQPGLRDHKGERASVNFFGNIANKVTNDKVRLTLIEFINITSNKLIYILILTGLHLQKFDQRGSQRRQ